MYSLGLVGWLVGWLGGWVGGWLVVGGWWLVVGWLGLVVGLWLDEQREGARRRGADTPLKKPHVNVGNKDQSSFSSAAST